MDVEVVEDEPTVANETETPEVGRIIYEQDVRAASHSNGRVADMVDNEVETIAGPGDVPPPELPDEREWPAREPKPGRVGPLAYLLAGIYVGAGVLSLYVGITMIRDLRKKEKKP